MKKILLAFTAISISILSVAQNYSSLFLANGNTSGVQQNPLSLGNWAGSQNTVPQYQFYTVDAGSTPLEIKSTRWSGGLILSRDGSSGAKNLMTVSGWEGFGTVMNIFNQSAQNTVSLNSDGTSYLNGGNVGIGTTNTGSFKLAVEGKVGAREVQVTLASWADHVFNGSNRDYTRMKLVDLKAYIKANNHLPNIPSEKEVKENGIALGEMNAKLLEKIEELTLYVIELKEELDELKKAKQESTENK